MAQKRLAWMNLPFGSTPKTSDVNGWGKHDAKLLAAVKKGETDKVKSVLKKGSVDPTKIEPTEGISSLHAAAANGRLEILNLFLTPEVNIETTDVTGKTALHHAADKGKANVTKRLLEAGANISAVDHNQLSALHHACSSGMIGCLLELLAMPHSPVNARDKDGKSPLSYAAWKGQASLCKLLLEKGAEINSRDNSGCTPLILAGMNGSAELCSFLIAQGADLSLSDNNGHNALWHCTNSKRGAHLHAARVIQEAMTGGGRPADKDTPVRRAHSEREVTERPTANIVYETTDDNNEGPKENLYEGINEEEEEYVPDYSDDDDAPSSASTAAGAASAAGPWQDALYGNEPRPLVMRTNTYLVQSDEQRRSPDEAVYADIVYSEPQTDEFNGLETMADHEEMLKTDDLLDGWRERLKKLEDESRSDSEAEDNYVKDPNQLLITFAQETTDSGAGGISPTVDSAHPPLSPADTFFNNLMATIAQRDQPPMAQDSKDLFPFDLETPPVEQRFSPDRSLSEDEMSFDNIHRENMASLTLSSDTKNDAADQLMMQQLEDQYRSQLEDLERKMTDAHENNNSLTQQLELSKDQTMHANNECDSVKHRLESAIGIKNWLHSELQALYANIETSEKRLTQTDRQESHRDKSDELEVLSDLEGFKQHVDYMLETSNVEDHHSIDLDISAQKTSLKMMEIKLDRLVKENSELRAKIKEEQQRKTDDRNDDFEKRMAHEYKKLDEEIEFKDADEMIAYVKDSIVEISRLREQNSTMTARLQSLDDLGITDKRSLFSELERSQALNRNLMDKIMILQSSIDEQSETIREKERSDSELGDAVKSYGEVAVQRDIFAKEYENLKLLLEKKMAESHVSQDELRELDEMRNKQNELLLIVARMEETGQQKENELQLRKKQIADFEEQLEDYGLIASERDLLRRNLDALSTTKAEFDVNNKELYELRRINLDLSETKKELLETIERRDAVHDEKETQIADLNRQLQDFGKLAVERDTILRELESLRSEVNERPTVVAWTAAESYSVPNEAFTDSVSGEEFGQIKQEVEKLREDLENKNEELRRVNERNNELTELILGYKTAEYDKLKRIEELSQNVREFELLLDVKKEEHKTEKRITESEHRKELEILSRKNEALEDDLEEARERVGDVEKLKADIHQYEDTLRQKNRQVEQLSEKISMLERETPKRLAIEDANDRIREEHRMMAIEIAELKRALESSHLVHASKDHEVSAVKPVKSDLLMAPPPPATDAIEEVRRLTAENAQLQERVVDLEKAFLKRISTNSSVDRPDDLDKSDVDGRHQQFQIMDDNDLEKSWKDLENFSTTGPRDEALKAETVNALKKMEAELADAELRNVALKANNRDLLQEVRGLRKTLDEQNRQLSEMGRAGLIPGHSSNAGSQKEGSFSEQRLSFASQMAAVATAEDTLEKLKELERLDKENAELRKEMEDRRRQDRVTDYQPPTDEAQMRKITELMSANLSLIADNETLQSEVKELKTILDIYRGDKHAEDNNRGTSEESDEEEPFKPTAIEQKSESLNNSREAERQIENYGKLAVERDVLLNEVNALKKLLNNRTITEYCQDEKELPINEVTETMSNYGKLATEKDILDNEVQRLKKLLDDITSSRSVEYPRQEANLDKEKDDELNYMKKVVEDFGHIATERDVLAKEVEHLKYLLDQVRGSTDTTGPLSISATECEKSKGSNIEEKHIIEQQAEEREDFGKLAVERDILANENKRLKNLLEELQSSERSVKQVPIFVNETQTSDYSSHKDNHYDDDYGRLAVERDILATEVKNLKKLLVEKKDSETLVELIHFDSLDSERPTEHMTVQANQTERKNEGSDNEQRLIDDYGKLAVERDILATEVKNLKKLLGEKKDSETLVELIRFDSLDSGKRSEAHDESENEQKYDIAIGKIAVERDVLANENKALKKLLEALQSSERPTEHMTVQANETERKNEVSDNEQRLNDDYGKLAVERDILANEVKNLKKLLEEFITSEKAVKHVHHEDIKAETRNRESYESDDEQKRDRDVGKIAVERDVLITENKALKKLLEELQSSNRPVEHISLQVNQAEKINYDSDNEQRLMHDYGKLAVERDILTNEVKNLKRLLEEMKASEKTVEHIPYETTKAAKRNKDSGDSDDDQPRGQNMRKIAVERDVLITENKALKKLLEELQSSERPAVQERLHATNKIENKDDSNDMSTLLDDFGKLAVERDVLANENRTLKNLLESLKTSEKPVQQMRVHASAAEKEDDDSDNEQRLRDDFGKLAVERDILANEVKHLKKLLEEMKDSEKAVKHIQYDTTKTERRSENSDESDDEQKREPDIGKIAVERDVLITENKALKKLLEELQSSNRPVEQSSVQVNKAGKSNYDSDNEQRLIDDYGKLAVERDILANEVKNLKRLLEEMKASEKTVKHIPYETTKTGRSENSDESDDEKKRDRDIGKIAVERDVLITENKALKKLLEELQSSNRPVEQSSVQVNKAGKSNYDSDNEQRLIDDYGKLAVERDILANEVKNLKRLLEEMKASEKTVKHIPYETTKTGRRSENSDESDDEQKRDRDIGKIAVERDVLITENKALKKLLEELQSSNRPVEQSSVQVNKTEKSNYDSDNDQRVIDDYGKLAVERDILANEVKNLKRLLEEMKASEKTVKHIPYETTKTGRRSENSDESDDEQKRNRDIGKIAVERDVLITENKALKKLLEELQSSNRPVEHISLQVNQAEKINYDSDNEQRLMHDYGKLAVERDILTNEVKNLKRLLEEMKASEKTVEHIPYETTKAAKRNKDSGDSDDDQPRGQNMRKIAVERDVLITENKALKKLLEELQSSERPAVQERLHATNKIENKDDSNDMSTLLDDFGKLAVERDVLANENRTLKNLLESLKTSEKPVQQMRVHASAAEKEDDDSDNEQRLRDDFGKLAVERDILANEVKHLKKLLEEMKDSEKAVKHIQYDTTKTERRSENSDESDDEQKREPDIGKIAVERDVLITENKALKKLLEELQSSNRPVEQSSVQVNKAGKSNYDSDNEQRLIDDYGKLAVERDILANEVKNLKRLLEEMKASEKTVKHIPYETTKTGSRSENSDESDDEQKRDRDIGKIAVERDVLITENKVLKKLLEESQSSGRPVEHFSVQANQAKKSNYDSDNEQHLIDDYGRLAVERDILANEVKNLKMLLEEMKTSEGTVKHIHFETIETEKKSANSAESERGQNYDSDAGKIAVERDILSSENKALKKLLEDLQSSERSVVQMRVDVTRGENISDNEKHLVVDYGKLAVANEVNYLKKLLEEKNSSEKAVDVFHSGATKTEGAAEDEVSGESDDEQRVDGDMGKIAIERDILAKENKMLKKLLAELQSYNKSAEVRLYKARSEEADEDLSDGVGHGNNGHDNQMFSVNAGVTDFGKLAVQHDILVRENQNLKKLLEEMAAFGQKVKNAPSVVVKAGKEDQDLCGNKNHSSELEKLTAERDALELEVKNLKSLLEETSNYRVSRGDNEDGDSLKKDRQLEELKQKLEDFEKVTTEKDILREELVSLKLVLNKSATQPDLNTAYESKQASIPILGAASVLEKSQEPLELQRRLLEAEEANHRLERSVSEIKEIAEKQSFLIQKKEKLIRSFHDKEKVMSDMQMQIDELKDVNLKLSQRVAEQEEIAGKQSDIIKKKEKRIAEINIFAHDYEMLSAEKDALCKQVEELKLLLEKQKGTSPGNDHLESDVSRTVATSKSTPDSKYVAENDIKAMKTELEQVKRNREELLTEVSTLEERLQDQDKKLMELEKKEHEYEKVVAEVKTLKRELDIAREQLRTEHKSTDLADVKRRDKQMLKSQPDLMTGSPLSSDDEENQVALNALRRKIAEKEKMIKSMDSADEEKQFLEEEIDELREKLNRQEATMDNTHTPVSDEDDLVVEVRKLRQDLESREHEIEKIRNTIVDERRGLQNQIERLKKEMDEHPSHLTVEYEASLLAKISDIEQHKKKLEDELRQNLEDREHEIERLRNADVDERRELHIQIECLKKAADEHPLHLTADHEADLLSTIADLDKQKKKLQSMMHEKEAQNDHEIKELVATNDELMNKLTEVRKKDQKQYSELVENNEELLENNGLLQKQCAELADEQEELLERDRLLQIEVKKLKEELQAAENKWLKDKAKLDDDNKNLRERLEHQKLSSAKEIEDLQNHIASLVGNISSDTKEKEDTMILTKQIHEFGNTVDNQADEISKKDKEIADLAIKLKQHVEVLAERDILSEKVERLEDLLSKKDAPSGQIEQQMALELGRPMSDTHPPEAVPDLREIFEVQRQTLESYEKKLNEQSNQMEDFGRLSVENDVLRRELNILRDLAREGDYKEKDHKLDEKHQQSTTSSDDQEAAALKLNVEHLTKQNKELRKKIDELEFSLMEEKENSDRKILELKWTLTKSEDDSNSRETETKKLREKIEDLERTVVEKSSAVASGGFGDDKASQKEENDRLKSEILELKLKLTRSEEVRSHRDLGSDERHTQLETLVQHLETENSKLKLKVSQLEAKLELFESKPETENQQQQKLLSGNASEYDVSYVRQIEDEVGLLREVNRALSKDIADLQYRLTEKLILIRSDGMPDVDSDRDYLHKKMKDFTQQSLKYLAEIQDLEEKNRRARQEAKTLRQENDELRDEYETLQEICHLHYTSPKDLVNRLRSENNKLQQFIKILEERMFKNVSSAQSPEPQQIDVKSISAESFGFVSRQSEDFTSEEGSSLSASQHLLFAGTLDECHQEIQRLRQINKDLEKRYKEIVSTYRSHLLASIQGRLDPEVKEALIRILRMKPTEYNVR